MTKLSVFEIRRENLRRLIKDWGGPTTLSNKLGFANASYLAQLCGPNPTRDVSERAARKIEAKLDLPQGWLDREGSSTETVATDISTERLARCIEIVSRLCREAGISPSQTKFSDVVAIAYTAPEGSEEQFVRRLIPLLK